MGDVLGFLEVVYDWFEIEINLESFRVEVLFLEFIQMDLGDREIVECKVLELLN